MPASSFVKREHTGGAVDTTITADINSTSLTIGIASSTGWPTGGANGPFIAIIDYDVAGKEKVEVQSRTGTTLTVADTGKRGIDGTSAASHVTGAKIRHCNSALEANEWGLHVSNDAAMVKHTSAALATDSVTQTQIAAGAVGTGEIIDANVTLAKLAANSVDAAKIVDGSVGTNELANLGVTTGKIADANVTLAKLAANSVDASKIVNNTITETEIVATQTMPYVGAGDPGAVGANKLWFDTTNRLWKVRNAANSGWETYGQNINAAWTTYSPTVSASSGPIATFGVWKQIGNLVIAHAGFNLPLGADITGLISVSLPVAADFPAGATGIKYVVGIWCQETTGPSRFAASGLIDPSSPTLASRFVNAATTVGFGASSPFDWGTGSVGDELFMIASYPCA